MVDKKNDENIPMKLSTLMKMEVDKESLPTSYKFFNNRLVYDKA